MHHNNKLYRMAKLSPCFQMDKEMQVNNFFKTMPLLSKENMKLKWGLSMNVMQYTKKYYIIAKIILAFRGQITFYIYYYSYLNKVDSILIILHKTIIHMKVQSLI